MNNGALSIGMNGTMLDEHPTGVGVYSFNVINNLSRLFKEEGTQPLTVFTPTRSFLNNNLRIVKLSNLLQSSKYGKLAALCRFAWNTFSYPFYARHFDLLISPTTHGSFFLHNQIITIHDLLSLRYKNISPHQRFYFRHLLPRLLFRARHIVAVSETTKQDIMHYFKCPEEKIRVIYNGYDHNSYYITCENEQNIFNKYGLRQYLLAVGPTYPHKNFEMLLQVYKELSPTLRKQHPLAIAGGKQAYINTLTALVKKLQLENDVHFLGYVPIQFMPSLYREASALVFPSLYEGFGIPLLEAMACGLPVIASNTSSMPEVCGNAALYIDPLDKNSLKAAIEKITTDTNLRLELREKGLIRVKQFSWEQTAREYKTLIQTKFQQTNY
jgi:glycosyltransferase involved in cell wall biosynthesis